MQKNPTDPGGDTVNIAHILPRSAKFPLAVHNGRYSWVLDLAQRQVRSGHTVTVYCHPSSQIDGVHIRGIEVPEKDKHADSIATFRYAFRDKNHDVYHSHFDNLHYEMAHLTDRPIVFTQHWCLTEETIRLAQPNPSNVWAVPPTIYMYCENVRHGIQTKNHIYHGINLDLFSRTISKRTDRLLFVGRVSPEKNLDLAISVALRSGLGLDIVGKVATKNSIYWDSLQHHVDGQKIRYHGSVPQSGLVHFYSSSKALIFPSDIGEAFGLTAIESQACGTQVLMKRGGSRGELIEEGVTGFLCEDEEEFVQAVRKCDDSYSEACIDFSKQFDIAVMARKYENLYRLVMNRD